ncbi:MAG: hypothetical protein GZ090_05570 [Oxalobacteraceae bacterium]|nr:hypothetical protein [Oxalobacteraceae bacterium]
MIFPETLVLLLLGLAGMALGLLVDLHGPGLAILASLCRVDAVPDLLLTLRLHWMWLPAMHVGMIVLPLGWSARHCRAAPLLRQLVCSAWMMAGMTGGAMAAAMLPGWPASPVGMLVMMCAGMAGGMLAGRAMRRLIFLSRFLRGKPELVHG